MVEKIAIQIALEGAAEVEQQLAHIGTAGTEAFAGLAQAASNPAEGIAKTGEASETTAGQLAKAGDSANQVGQSFNQVAQESLKTATAVADLTGTIAEHALKIGFTVQAHRGWTSSLLSLASGAGTAARSLGLLSPQFALLGTGVGGVALTIAKAVAAFELLETAVTKFAASGEKANNTLQTLAGTSGKSFDDLQRGEAVFGQIGIKAETFRDSIAKINETLAGTDVKKLSRGMTDIVAVVKEIAAGEKGITFAGWVKAEDKVKGVSIAMKQAADAGKDATQVLLEFLRSADLGTAIKVGAAFGLSEADVDRVRRLKENISDLNQRIAGAPPLISPESAAAFDRMRTSLQNLDSARARFSQAISTVDFSAMAASLSATMNDMEASVTRGAAAIAEGMGQAIRGMSTQAASDVAAIGAALSSLGQQTGVTSFFQQMGTDARNAVTGVNAAIAGLVGGIMQSFGASAASIQAVKDQINGIAPAANAAGQAVQQSGVMFTQWGTLAQQGANTAKEGAQQAATQFTSFGTVASQSGEKAQAAMVQAAGGATTIGTAVQGGADKLDEFAFSLAGIAWDSISGAGVAAWDAIAGAVQEAASAIGNFVSSLVGITWDAISDAGVAAWNALTSAIQNAISALLRFIGLKPSAPATGGGAPGKARGGLLGGRGTGTSDSNLAWVSRGEYVVPARATAQPGVLAFLEALRRSGRIPGFAEGGFIRGVAVTGRGSELADKIVGWVVQIAQANNQTRTALENMVNQLSTTMDALTTALFQVAQEMTATSNALNNASGSARGGLLGGRGTGTSDSNLAWVSRGEYVVPARATAQPGVLAFLEALRRSGGNLSRVLDGMGRFALGGMVPRAIPAFAGGGLAGGSNVTIQFPGLPAISGLRASSDVVDQLQKAAALAQVRSGGRKPSRYS